jgi:hypothetical protein
MQTCLFCDGDASEPDHLLHCDGRQGQREATSAWPDFDGETYVHERDHDRLNAQLARVHAVMRDHQWHTLDGVATVTGDPPASVSARLRDLRKNKFGGLAIERRYVSAGLWEYRWTVAVQETAAP